MTVKGSERARGGPGSAGEPVPSAAEEAFRAPAGAGFRSGAGGRTTTRPRGPRSRGWRMSPGPAEPADSVGVRGGASAGARPDGRDRASDSGSRKYRGRRWEL
jgi:hypothetical protein